jgi:protein-L-isoaspartate O-methyltransferase
MCATDAVPEELIRQVREGGRVVIPIGRGPGQTLNRLRKVGGRLLADVMPMPIRVDIMACRPDK